MSRVGRESKGWNVKNGREGVIIVVKMALSQQKQLNGFKLRHPV